MLRDKNWKTKKQGLDQLEATFTTNLQRVKISNSTLIDLVGAIRICLTDNNKNIVRNFTSLVAKVCLALDAKDTKGGHLKALLQSLYQNLSDKNTLIRQEVISTLLKLGTYCGYDQLILYGIIQLQVENPEYRQEFLQLVNTKIEKNSKIEMSRLFDNLDLKQAAGPLISSMLDKNQDIRGQTEELVSQVCRVHGAFHFKEYIKNLKPAIRQQLNNTFSTLGCDLQDQPDTNINTQPILDKIKDNKKPKKEIKKTKTTPISRLPSGQEIKKELT